MMLFDAMINVSKEKMHKTAEVLIQYKTTLVTQLNCNQCGNCIYKHKPVDVLKDFEDRYNLVPETIEENGLYVEKVCADGNKFRQGESFNFFICENCLFELVQSFALKPRIINTSSDDIIENEEEFG
jgi:hypothetical protein